MNWLRSLLWKIRFIPESIRAGLAAWSAWAVRATLTIEVMSVAYLESAYRDAFAFGLMILILIARPSGLFQSGMKLER